MSTLRELLHDYLSLRRSLGFKLRTDGTGLAAFVSFMEQAHEEHISTDLALAWATQPAAVQASRWTNRLRYVRGFARYCSAVDARNQVPPAQLLAYPSERPLPYFLTQADVTRLLQDARQWPAKAGLANHTYHCLFGLLCVSGLRISEALGLTLSDVDLDDGVLTIRSSKFGKSRMVPLHATSADILKDYCQRREHLLAGRSVAELFVNEYGKRLGYDAALDVFHRLTAELPHQPGRSRPRLHDLRHYFALATVTRWYMDGDDVERRLPVLSSFLGHVEVSNTYWYLSACPQLLGAAMSRLQHHWEPTP